MNVKLSVGVSWASGLTQRAGVFPIRGGGVVGDT